VRGRSVEMSDIQDSWSIPGAGALTAAVPVPAYPVLRDRGWFIAWVCSAAACLAGAALTRYPQPSSFTGGVSCEIASGSRVDDTPSVPRGTAGSTFPIAESKH